MSKISGNAKPLKGSSASSAISIPLVTETVITQVSSGNTSLSNVSITGGTIDGVVIGQDSAGPIYSATLIVGNENGLGYNVIFYGDISPERAEWISSLGKWQITGDMSVSGITDLGNLRISGNTVSTTNLNGDIIFDPQGTGGLVITGDIEQYTTSGNVQFATTNGSFLTTVSDNINLTSTAGELNILTDQDQNISTNNGDIYLNSGLNKTSVNITNISTGSSPSITTSTVHLLEVGDNVKLGGTNSIPTVDNSYTVTQIVTPTIFKISTTPAITSSGNTGSFVRVSDIYLNSSNNINIPYDVKLTFGIDENYIMDTFSPLNELNIVSKADLNLSPAVGMDINIPTGIGLTFGSDNRKIENISGLDLSITADGNLNLTNISTVLSGNLIVNGPSVNLNSDSVTIKDPIVKISNRTLLSNDLKDIGLEFNYYDSSQKLGWFGYDNSQDAFTFLKSATNTEEVISGTLGDARFDVGYFNSVVIPGGGTISAGTWEASTIQVLYGGTGSTFFNNNSVLIGNGTSPVSSFTNLTYNGTILSTPSINSTTVTPSTSSTTGSVTIAGGIAISNTTDAVSSTNGGTLTTAGGASIAKKLFVGTDLSIGGNLTVTGTVNIPHSGLTNLTTTDDHTQYLFIAGRINGQVATGGTLSGNNLVLRSTTNATKGSVILDETSPSTSSGSGALRISGGLGISNTTDASSAVNGGTFTTAGGASIAKKLFVGTDLSVGGSVTNGVWNGSTITVPNGGTGSINFTSNSVLLGNGVGAIQSSSMTYTSNILSIPSINSTTTTSSSVSPSVTGAVILAGGLTITKNTDASSITTGGSFTTIGGASIGQRLFVGGDVSIGGNVTNGSWTANIISVQYGGTGTSSHLNNSLLIGTSVSPIRTTSNLTYDTTTNVLTSSKFVLTDVSPSITNISGSMVSAGGIGISNTTDAVSITNGGTFTTAGGVAIAKKLFVGGNSSFGDDLNMNANYINNLLDPVLPQDAATKQYVDANAQGLTVKDSVISATVSPGTLISSFENGDTIDGVVLNTGDRILIKDQVNQIENGIYVVNVSGAPSRASDFLVGEAVTGSYVFIESGTVNGNSGWVCTSIIGQDIVGTNNILFSQFSGAGVLLAGTGLTKLGNTFNVNANLSHVTGLGTITSGVWQSSSLIQVPYGGTGRSTFTFNSVLLGNGDQPIQNAVGMTYASNTLTLPRIISNDTTPSILNTTGSITIAGGIGISNTTDAISITNGGTFTTAGGVAIAKNLYVGLGLTVPQINVCNLTCPAGVMTLNSTTSIKLNTGTVILPDNSYLNFGETGSPQAYISKQAGDLIIKSQENIYLTPGSTLFDVILPTNSAIFFSGLNGTQKIESSSSTQLTISSSSFLNLSQISGGVKLTEGLPLHFNNLLSTKITGDSSGNLIVNSLGNLNLIPDTGNITIPVSKNIEMGNASTYIGTSSLNNIILSTTGSITNSNVSHQYFNSSGGNIYLSPVLGKIIVPQNIKIEFGGTTEYIQSDLTGGLIINADNNISLLTPNGEISLSPENYVNIPWTKHLRFGSSAEYIFSTGSGNLTISSLNSIISGNLVVNGATLSTFNTPSTIINSLNVKIMDPILTLGGTTSVLTLDDQKDRGIEFKYFKGITERLGYFGYDDTDGYFMYVPIATNTEEVISGTLGNCKFSTGSFTSLNLNNGALTSVNLISSNNNLTIDPGNGSNLILNVDSGANITIPPNVDLLFDGEDAKIYSDGTDLILDVTSPGKVVIDTDAEISGDLTINGNINITGSLTLNFSTQRISLAGNTSSSPNGSSNVTFISVTSPGIATGNMISGSIDGFVKNICISSLFLNSTYELTFPTGSLMDPGTGSTVAKKMIFDCPGQAVQMVWDNVGGFYIITQGGGVLVAL